MTPSINDGNVEVHKVNKASRAEGGYNLTTKRSRAAAGVVARTQSTVFLNYEDVYDRSESMWHLNK